MKKGVLLPFSERNGSAQAVKHGAVGLELLDILLLILFVFCLNYIFLLPHNQRSVDIVIISLCESELCDTKSLDFILKV